MDRELAFHRTGGFSVPRFLDSPTIYTPGSSRTLSHDPLDQANGSCATRIHSLHSATTIISSPAPYIPTGHTLLYPHGYTLRQCNWHALCSEFALPVLRVHCVGVAILALESRAAPCADLRSMDGAGMGMECIPKHKHKFDGRGWVSSGTSPRRLGGHSEGIQRRQRCTQC